MGNRETKWKDCNSHDGKVEQSNQTAFSLNVCREMSQHSKYRYSSHSMHISAKCSYSIFISFNFQWFNGNGIQFAFSNIFFVFSRCNECLWSGRNRENFEIEHCRSANYSRKVQLDIHIRMKTSTPMNTTQKCCDKIKCDLLTFRMSTMEFAPLK